MSRRLAGVVAAVVLVAAASCGEAARDFYVGGRDGWTTNPSEPYNRWAERNRFQVHDRLVFRYAKKGDSVVVVSQSHYDACNATDPFLRDGGGAGESTFVFDNSGPFFFISGDPARCHAGESLIVVVLAVRNNNNSNNTTSPNPPPPAIPSPAASGKNGTAPAPSPKSSPAPPPSAPSPAGGSFTAPAAGGTNGTAVAPSPETVTGKNGTASSPSTAASMRGGASALLMLFVVISGALSVV
uniref:Phytocyanin domain-containing protein n=1 Tax=Leersia perrieri TaxID=77586 RepID=A0A0D9UY05_9ORYZ